jgi:putative ABC transport system permease protein
MPSLTTVEPTLHFDDARAIEAQVPGVLRVSESQNAFDIDVKYREHSGSPMLFGVTPAWTQLRGDEIAIGSDIAAEDVAGLARVAVIGADVRSALFGTEDPIGKVIRIADVPFTVKGVLASRGVGPGGASMDNMLTIPVSTASKRLFNRDYLTTIIVQLREPDKSAAAIAEITALLRERHKIAANAADDFNVSSPRATMAQIADVGSTLSRVLSGVGIIAVIIGAAVIAGLMLIAVGERRREIGVCRAVGAQRNDILLQFLLEAIVVATLGGIVGVVLGAGGTAMATRLQSLPVAFNWTAIALALLGSVLLGLLAGLQPAWRAAGLDPIDALRT